MSIVLIDLHQLNVKKQLQTIQISDTEYGATSCQRKNRTRRTTTRNIRFPNQMIEQINIALEQKRSGNFSAWVIEACRRRLTSEREHIHQLKVMKNEHPAFFPPNRTIL